MTLQQLKELIQDLRKELDGQPLIKLYDGKLYKVIPEELLERIEKMK